MDSARHAGSRRAATKVAGTEMAKPGLLSGGWHRDISGGKSRTLKKSVGMAAKGDAITKGGGGVSTKGGMKNGTTQPSRKGKK